MTTETSQKIKEFLENTLPDGSGYILLHAPSCMGDGPHEVLFTLQTNVSPRSIIGAAGAIIANAEHLTEARSRQLDE